jgi:hypothetical protein
MGAPTFTISGVWHIFVDTWKLKVPRWDDFQLAYVIPNFVDINLLVEKTDSLLNSHTYYRSLRRKIPRSHVRETQTP